MSKIAYLEIEVGRKQGLRPGRKMIHAGFEAERLWELKYKSCRKKIFYPWIEAVKKDCLCKGLRIVWGLPEQRNIYNIPHLKVSLEATFFRNDLSKQKSFDFLPKELHDECSASISVFDICFEHLQQRSYEKLSSGIYLQE